MIRARARRRPEVHPPVRGRGPDRRRARTPAHRPALRLLARARAAYLVMRLIGDGSLADVARRRRVAARSGRIGVRPARRVRCDVCAPQRRRPPRRQAGEHPDRPRRQRVPHRLRHGVALRTTGATIAAANSSTGASLDAPYASPEQLGGRPMSPASDVYSLAVVAARALTGLTGDYEAVRGALPASGAHRARPRHGHRPCSPLRRARRSSARRLAEALGAAPDRRARRWCDREPVQGAAGLRGSRRRRFLRARATRRAADRPSRRARHPWTVRGRGRAERQRQVERRPSGARAGVGGRRAADVARLVPGRDDTGAAPVRGARGGAQSRRRRSSGVHARHRPRPRWRARGPSSASSPTDATSCSW